MHTQVFTYYSLPLQQALSCFTVSLYAHVALHKAKSKNLAEILFPKLFELEKRKSAAFRFSGHLEIQYFLKSHHLILTCVILSSD